MPTWIFEQSNILFGNKVEIWLYIIGCSTSDHVIFLEQREECLSSHSIGPSQQTDVVHHWFWPSVSLCRVKGTRSRDLHTGKHFRFLGNCFYYLLFLFTEPNFVVHVDCVCLTWLCKEVGLSFVIVTTNYFHPWFVEYTCTRSIQFTSQFIWLLLYPTQRVVEGIMFLTR